MKLKLDENLSKPLAVAFRAAGHDAATVPEEELCGATDYDLIEQCRKEERAIVYAGPRFRQPAIIQAVGLSRYRRPADLETRFIG